MESHPWEQSGHLPGYPGANPFSGADCRQDRGDPSTSASLTLWRGHPRPASSCRRPPASRMTDHQPPRGLRTERGGLRTAKCSSRGNAGNAEENRLMRGTICGFGRILACCLALLCLSASSVAFLTNLCHNSPQWSARDEVPTERLRPFLHQCGSHGGEGIGATGTDEQGRTRTATQAEDKRWLSGRTGESHHRDAKPLWRADPPPFCKAVISSSCGENLRTQTTKDAKSTKRTGICHEVAQSLSPFVSFVLFVV